MASQGRWEGLGEEVQGEEETTGGEGRQNREVRAVNSGELLLSEHIL